MRWKIAAVAGWACVLVGLLLGAGKSNEVRTRQLVIEDEKGRSRIVLESEDSEPAVSFYDEAGEIRCSLSLSKNGPMLGMTGHKNADRLLLWLDDEDGSLPALTMFDDKAKPRVYVGVTEADPPIMLYGTPKGDIAIPAK